MQWSRLRAADAVLLLSLLSAPLPALSASLDCNDVRIDKESFNLSKLGGPHSVVTSRANELGHLNTTYTVDICKPLVKKNEACPKGTRGTFKAGLRRTASADKVSKSAQYSARSTQATAAMQSQAPFR